MSSFLDYKTRKWSSIIALLGVSVYLFGGLKGALETPIWPEVLGGFKIITALAIICFAMAIAIFKDQLL